MALGFFNRLKAGLSRSTQKLSEGITGAFTRRKLDDAALEELEETLIAADLGTEVAARVIAAFRRSRFGREVTDEEVKTALAGEIAEILAPVARPLEIDPTHKPFVVLVVGVNGTGKTTTSGKLAALYRSEGKSVLLCAADTFRAAAIEQLEVWAQRSGVDLIKTKQGGDPAAALFDAATAAKARGTDVLLVDTAGRLHTKSDLMKELDKMRRIAERVVPAVGNGPAAPHQTLLVIDATTGQNGLQQARLFTEAAAVTGIVLTKLDGSAKGGIVVAIAHEMGLPVRYAGVGEKLEDIIPFDAEAFVDSLID